jgi:ribose-phosphate pyrophosphokinase
MNGVILLGDKNSKSWEFAERIQNHLKKISDYDIPLREVTINHFRNGEIDMHVPENVRKKEVYFIHDSNKDPQEWWVELLLLKDLLLSASAESVSFVLPNLLYSRKDRKEKPHVPISARALARTISSGIKRIITMDMHAAQIQGFYNEDVPIDNLYSFPEVVQYLIKNPICDLNDLVILSPDAGGVSRARSFVQRIGVRNPLAMMYKVRSTKGVGNTQELEEMKLVGDVKDKHVLIVDDIIDSGGTLCEASKLVKEYGAKKVSCYGTHGIFTKGTSELASNFENIMTSNTYFNEDSNLKIIDMSSAFAEAIYRAQKGISISKLFE